MLKRLILLFFFILSVNVFAQEKVSIQVNPPNMKATSSILIKVENNGSYTLKISDSTNRILFSKDIEVSKILGFKHNFSKYQNGTYYFSLYRDNKEVLKISKTK